MARGRKTLGSRLQRLWTRRSCLAAALALAMPAAATSSPIHRIVAIGDLHGDFSAWRDIVRSAQLVDEDGRWVGGEAVLVQTGDVVDRGPDSLKIIQDLMRLQQEAERVNGRIIAVVGNHEAMNVTGDFRYVSAGDYAAFADSRSAQRRENVYLANKKALETVYRQRDPQMTGDAVKRAWFEANPLGSIEHRIAWEPKGTIGRWIVGNPAVVLLDGTLFVHGGISPAYAKLPIAEINALVRAALIARATDPQSIIHDPKGPLWYRGLAISTADTVQSPITDKLKAAAASEQVELPINDQLEGVLFAYGAKRIVIGHTPALSGIAMLFDGRLIRIDTGISRVYGGKVSYLDILDGNPVAHVVERSSHQ